MPWTWIVLGVVITAVDHWTSGGRNLMANILINFALLRLALPAVEAHVMPYPGRLAAAVAAIAALLAVLDPYLEYGGGGWLWALLGLSHRLHRSRTTGHRSCGATCSPSRPASPTCCANAGGTASIPRKRRSSPSWWPF